MKNEIGILMQQRDLFMLSENDEQAERIQAIIDKKLSERSSRVPNDENHQNGVGRED